MINLKQQVKLITRNLKAKNTFNMYLCIIIFKIVFYFKIYENNFFIFNINISQPLKKHINLIFFKTKNTFKNILKT